MESPRILNPHYRAFSCVYAQRHTGCIIIVHHGDVRVLFRPDVHMSVQNIRTFSSASRTLFSLGIGELLDGSRQSRSKPRAYMQTSKREVSTCIWHSPRRPRITPSWHLFSVILREDSEKCCSWHRQPCPQKEGCRPREIIPRAANAHLWNPGDLPS